MRKTITNKLIFPITFTRKENISLSTIRDLLCDALEGSSNYWYFIEEMVEPKNFALSENKEIFKHLDYPIMTYPKIKS